METGKFLRRNLKRCTAVFSAAALLVLISAAAFAADTAELIEPDRTGSVSVTMQTSDGTVVGGGSLELYQVAEVYIDEVGQNSYELTADFAESGAVLDDISSGELAETLDVYIKEAGLSSYQTAEIDGNGSAIFTDLPVGVYLVVQSEAASGYYAVCSFVVTVPMFVDGMLTYDVDASPKVEAAAEITTLPSSGTTAGTKAASASVLPQTGAILWPILLAGCAGLALLFSGGFMVFGRRNVKNEA